MLDHLIAKNATAHKVYKFLLHILWGGKGTILGPGLRVFRPVYCAGLETRAANLMKVYL